MKKITTKEIIAKIESNQQIYICGSATWEVHKNIDTNFYVYKFKAQIITIKGEMFSCNSTFKINAREEIKMHYTITLNGYFDTYKDKPVFRVSFVSVNNSDKVDVEEIIVKLKIKGLGKKTVKKIIDTYPVDTLEKLKDPRLLSKVHGISTKKAIEISTAYRQKTSTENLLNLAYEYSLPDYVVQLLQKFSF